MTQTTILEAGTAAGTSDEVVVGANPVVIILYAEDAKIDASSGVQCPVKRKIDTDVYQPCPDEHGPVFLSGARLECVIHAPGTYVVEKPETVESLGFKTDSV